MQARYVQTRDPNGLALRTMAQTAHAAARTWTLQEWAGRLASRAGPRDYVGQLRQLYDGILDRWRYVKEPGERVPGSARALLHHVLGAGYNGTDPERTDVERTRWQHKGWGDCDDVSTLVAAGVLALGMTPYFRVVPGHVSVIAETPRGERVSLDPVGAPEHPFGWALPSDREQLHPVSKGGPMYLQGLENQPQAWHYAATRADDARGPRVLAMPGWAKRYFDLGMAVERCPAVDQYGQSYYYDGGVDLFVPSGQQCTCQTPMGAIRRRGPRRRGPHVRRRRATGRVLRRIVQRVGKVGRKVGKVAGALARSPAFQQVASMGLQAVGVPGPVTKGVLAAGGNLQAAGGVRQLAKLAKRDPGKALSMAAQAAAAGAQAAGGRMPFGCVEMQQMGSIYTASPVLAFVGVDGVYGFGQVDIATTPIPGRYYRVKSGDTLLGITGKAYNIGSGSERLRRSKWINNAQVNRVYWVKPQKDFNKEHYPDGIVYLTNAWASDPEAALRGEPGKSYPVLYIPVTEGDEPPAEPTGPAPELPDVDEPVEPAPPTVLPPTDEPEAPIEPLPPVAPPPPQQPVIPVEPVGPSPFDPYAPTPGMLIDTPVHPNMPTPAIYEPGTPEPPQPAFDPGKYQIPTCPPGYGYDYRVQQCMPVIGPGVDPTSWPPGQGPQQPPPVVEPPTQPTGPDMPWMDPAPPPPPHQPGSGAGKADFPMLGAMLMSLLFM